MSPGFADGTSYLFDVIATNSIGDSDPSQKQAPAIPSAPVAQSRYESAKVGWIAQPTTVGGDPTSYTITASPTANNSCTINLPDDTCTITGLSNSQAYTFTATATNAIGTSSASAASGSVTRALRRFDVADSERGRFWNRSDPTAACVWHHLQLQRLVG